MAAAEPEAATGPRWSALVVDAEADIGDLIGEIFGAEGYSIDRAASASSPVRP